MSRYDLLVRVQLGALFLTAVIGGLLKSEVSEVRPVHILLGAIIGLTGLVSVIVAFARGKSANAKLYSVVAFIGSILGSTGGRMTKTVDSYDTGYALMIVGFLVAVVAVGANVYSSKKAE